MYSVNSEFQFKNWSLIFRMYTVKDFKLHLMFKNSITTPVYTAEKCKLIGIQLILENKLEEINFKI